MAPNTNSQNVPQAPTNVGRPRIMPRPLVALAIPPGEQQLPAGTVIVKHVYYVVTAEEVDRRLDGELSQTAYEVATTFETHDDPALVFLTGAANPFAARNH